MGKQKIIWSCKECGHTQTKWAGSCSACKQWNTFAEEMGPEDKDNRFLSRIESQARPIAVKDITSGDFRRIETKITEFDRVLGGGIVAGSLTLIAGDPGIGKSTLLLQISEALAQQGLVVLYVCGEESAEQTSLRARRLNVQSENLFLLSETLFSHIKLHVDQLKPDVLIIDSVQILYKNEIASAPGSVAQVREIATECMHLSKGMGISTFLIGHVTKSGEIAGPRVLEHIVDTVLDFEGDKQHGYRLLRSVKNRFGPTDDIALFQMESGGLVQIPNPSQVFLQERMKEVSGTVVVASMEGSRAILIELQALVAASAFSTSTRKCTGLDQNRLALLLAVLEKKMGYALHHSDVFVSVAGGMKVLEPAIDLGVVVAIASSFCNRPIAHDTIVIGEVGLGGEVRRVPRIESRLKEAIHMGFQKCFIPRKNLDGLSPRLMDKISIRGVNFVEEVLSELLC